MSGPFERIARGVEGFMRRVSRGLPSERRRRWISEWTAEWVELERRGASGAGRLRFALGGLRHVLWMRWDEGLFRDLRTDLRQAGRGLRRTPGFCGAIVVVLGLGIGVNVALSTVSKAVLLDEPGYPDAERLVVLDLLLQTEPGGEFDTIGWSYPKFASIEDQLSGLERMAAYSLRSATLTGAGTPVRIGVESVSPDYWNLVGVTPIHGRAFTEDAIPPNPAPVALLSEGLWRTRYGSDPSVVGRSVFVEGASLEVIGVIPDDFRGVTGGADLWIPMAGVASVWGERRLQLAWAHWFQVLGRRAPERGLEAVREEAGRLAPILTEAYFGPDEQGAHSASVVPLLDARVNGLTRTAVFAISAGGWLLLLIACTNVAGLFLARTESNRGALAVRAALGGSPARIARLPLFESLALGLAGGVFGLALAYGTSGLVRTGVTYALELGGGRGLRFLDPGAIGIDPAVLLGTLLIAAFTGVACGWLPARLSRRWVKVGTFATGRSAGLGVGRDGRGPARLRWGLIIGQLALTLLILCGAGLFSKSWAELSRVPLGFDPTGVVAAQFELPPGTDGTFVTTFAPELVRRIEAIPGVEFGAVSSCGPVRAGGCDIVGVTRLDDQPEIPEGSRQAIRSQYVTDRYFDLLGIGFSEGASFPPGLGPDDPPVVLLSRGAAENLFPGRSAVGHRIAVTNGLTTPERMATVVGVVDDVAYGALEDEPDPVIYFTSVQSPQPYGSILFAGSGPAGAAIPAVREALAEMDPDLALSGVTDMEDRVWEAGARTQVIVWLSSLFGLLALVLCGAGLYGLVSYAASRRYAEVGIRMALGAEHRSVVRLFLSHPMWAASIGVGLGITGAFALTRYLRPLLFDVNPIDPTVFAAASLLLLGTALVAALRPALRAGRLDPATTLRSD